jgi:SAM-dependent methyltransferase
MYSEKISHSKRRSSIYGERNDRFDILIAESVNVFIPDKARAFSEYKRVIKPGGVVGINEAILTKTPPGNAADLLADYVGNDILPASYWKDIMETTGFKDIISREYQVEMRKESRSQMGFFSTGDYLGLLWNMLKVTFGRDPFVRNLAKRSMSSPREFYNFFGYGLFVGWKLPGSISRSNRN